ncbi:MAG: HAMP domain-containing histidine kinase [Endomicrobia bacterium]|nr:HAMP domain-containing histidine kinase [Endomicrobiia bacterium]MCL2507300.1 HAMP domain-containing histidine kinase [Endomicrobiia bacterium]
MNLRLKFTLSVSILLLFVIFLVSYIIFSAQKDFLTEQFQENRDTSFKLFFHTAETALKANEEQYINNILNSIVTIYKPSIVYASYVSGYRQVFVSRDDKNVASAYAGRMTNAFSSRTEEYESLMGEQIYEYASPILYGDKYLGTIIVGFSQDYKYQKIDEGISLISRQIQIAAFIAFIFGILGANFMAVRLIKPVKQLAEAAKQIGEGNMDVKTGINRSDEIGVLAHVFDEMVDKVKDADTLKDTFVSSVSHELRSPLAAIDGYCDLLIEGINKKSPPEQQLRGLKIIKDASIRLTNFINNILDLAKMRAGKYEMKASEISLETVIREIAVLFESLAVAQNKVLKLNIAPNLPTVYADPEKIKQVITNILGNAFKFTKENDTITISSLVSPSYGNDFIEVQISDSGVGLSKTDAEKVFEKFYQVKDDEFNKPKGTGLGLSIVYEIIRLHHGRIWAEGEQGAGSSFKFVLPVFKKF